MVAYNFNNLWFAAHAENWPLAQFYANETRVRLRWALRITPVPASARAPIQLEMWGASRKSELLASVTGVPVEIVAPGGRVLSSEHIDPVAGE